MDTASGRAGIVADILPDYRDPGLPAFPKPRGVPTAFLRPVQGGGKEWLTDPRMLAFPEQVEGADDDRAWDAGEATW